MTSSTAPSAITDPTKASATFAIPEGGTDALLHALASHDAALPVLVYERINPATREPVDTWIGLRVKPHESADAREGFALLRRTLEEGGHGAEVLAFVGFPQAPSDGAGTSDTPGALVMTLLDRVRLDHATGTGHVVVTPSPAGARSAQGWADLLATAEPDPRQDDGSDEAGFAWRAQVGLASFVDVVRRLHMATGEQAGAEVGEGGGPGGAVLSVPMASEVRADPVRSYRTLRRINPSTCMFLVRHGGFALWGSTSLSLVEVDHGALVAETDGATRPVPAGTPQEVFTWEPTDKERYEYDVVASALYEDLVAVSAPGSLRFTREAEQRTFFGLAHLFAEVRADLAPGLDAVAVVEALSPHGAAVGHPRSRALKLIEELEPVPRGPYAGVIGVFRGSDGSADVAAVIRSMWTTPAGSFTRAGAKIVPASVAEEEYAESLLKTRALRESARANAGGQR